MYSTVKTSGRFSTLRGLRASVPFLPLPHPLPSTFLLSPYFPRGPNVKNSLAQPDFRSLRTRTLATQATLSHLNRPCSMYQYSNMAPRFSGQNCIFFLSLSITKGDWDTKKTHQIRYRSFSWKPRSYVKILIYWAWPKSILFWPGKRQGKLQQYLLECFFFPECLCQSLWGFCFLPAEA